MSTTSASANLGRSVKLDDIYVYREANYGDADTLKNTFDKVTTAAGGEQAVKDAAGSGYSLNLSPVNFQTPPDSMGKLPPVIGDTVAPSTSIASVSPYSQMQNA